MKTYLITLALVALVALACAEPEPPKVWMEATEVRYVDCFYDGYKIGVARAEVEDYYWVAVDVFYECKLERPNRTYVKVADYVECLEQARVLWRSGYDNLSEEATAVIEEDMEVLYPKTLCWPANELRDLPDADDFIPPDES